MRLLVRLSFIVLGTLLLSVSIGYHLATKPLPIESQGLIKVEPGDHFEQVVAALGQEGYLGDGWQQQVRRWILKGRARTSRLARRLQVGEYPIEPGDSLLDILDRLQNSAILQRSFVLVDGWNFRQIRHALAKQPSLQQRLPALSDREVAKLLGLEQTSPEGWLAPDTYFYTLGTSDLDVVRRAYAGQVAIVERAWEKRQNNLPYQTPYEALVMASLVEKETSVRSEMPIIAGVFINRLRKGMKLQTDPTVIYSMGEAYQGRIRLRDLRLDSPYNTYVYAGLPPGPIAMPGKQAIEAALQPEQTKALYFVAKGDGTHQFSKTLSEHNAAVKRYQLNRGSNYRSTPLKAAGGTP